MTLLNTANNVMLGAQPVDAAYAGPHLVWQRAWQPRAVAPLVLDADTIAQADGSAVASWGSTGSNTSYAAAQATPGMQPTLAKNVLGGRAVVRFNGSNLLQVPAFDTGTVSLSMVMLAQLAAPGFYPMAMVYRDSPVDDWELRGNGGSGALQFIADGGSTSFACPTANLTAWHILVGVYLSNWSCGVYQDGVSLGVNSGGIRSLAPGQKVWIGQRTDGYPFTGDIACLMIVKGDLADADRQKIEGWIAHRWGLTALLPANHPYKVQAP